MRTRIKVGRTGDVTLTRTDPLTGEIERTTYYAPADGYGYVRIRSADMPQVCEGLSGSGVTLMSTRAGLPALIRREHRKSVRWERRMFGDAR